VFNKFYPPKSPEKAERSDRELPGIEMPEPEETNVQRPLSTAMAEINSNKNILSSDVEIKGSVKFQNELIIDGKVEGEISSPGVLTVGENAVIHGEIKTKSATILGKVNGNITVDERCELKTRAQLIGDLKAARLQIEEGATFVGKSEVTPNKVAMKPEIVRSPEAQKAASGGGR
jgi:cytoskeletal protein CcmA (bactofilin family)